MIMSFTWTTLVLVGFLFFLLAFLWKKIAQAKRLPPGPKGFPIFGSLHLLGKYPHRNLHKLALKYGSIMHLRLGFVPTIVVSSPPAAELFLKTHDLVFASRPPLEVSKHIVFSTGSPPESAKDVSYDQQTLTFGQYGSYWRTMRKICTLELLTSHKINSFRSMRKRELDLVIAYIKEAAGSGISVNLSDRISCLSADVTCQMLFGKKYLNKDFDESGYKAIMDEVLTLLGTPNWADYFTLIGLVDFQKLAKRMKTVSKLIDEFFEKIIDEHVQSKDEYRTKDFIDVMLGFTGVEESKYHINRGEIKAVIMDMFGAANGTSSITILWALSQLLKNPRVMKKVQKELEDKVGKERMVEETDLDNLEYLDMVIKETLRLHPVLPLLLPHESRENCTVDGFHIPKKSRIIINAWTIGRDSSVWNDPEKFFPERFVGCNIDFNGRSFQFLPFGSGRRSCPGMQLGLTMVRLVLAQLVHCFDWELPDGVLAADLDMTEVYSVVIFRATELLGIPRYRLNK